MPCSYHVGAVFQIKREAVLMGDELLMQTFMENRFVIFDIERKIR
jgi:hypothetical protein